MSSSSELSNVTHHSNVSSDHQFSKVLPEKVYSLSILQVAETFEFVLSDERVLHLAELFQVHSEQMVVGVCDLKGKALGFISRVHLLTLLGKPFGRDVLSRKKVSDVLETSVPLDMNANIFQVAEKIQDTMERSILQYYLLTNNEGKYRGIFSSKDLLAYLSKMTHEDVRLAGQLQERLVKNRFALAGEGWSIEAFSQSAKGMGGDFYHVIPLKSGRVFLALGDVSGKGVAASVITSLIWGMLQFYEYNKGLKGLLVQINEALIRTFQLEKYLTGVFLIYNPKTRKMIISDLGHGHLCVVRRGRVLGFKFPETNVPLGIDLDLKPKVFRTRLRPRDLICLYTDGLIEQESEEGSEFGEEKLRALARSHWKKPGGLPDAILEALFGHQGSIPRLDDVTWVQLRVDESAHRP